MGFTKLLPKLAIEELQKLMRIASNQASTVSANSDGTVDGNEVYLETLAYEINEFFSGRTEILKNAWRAWLDHTGYDETDWEFNSFVSQWRNNKFSLQGVWVESWIGGVESAIGEKTGLSEL